MPFTLNSVRMSFRRFALGAVACLGLGSLFSGCSTDLDPNADYKEITVLYSILNPSERIHYVKVTKAFQNNNADARSIASTLKDSLYYGPEMQVKLQKLKADSSVLAEYPLVRIDTTGKDPGTFFSGSQILYRTHNLALDDQAIYRVVATNTRTGNVAKAATAIIKDARFCVFQVSIKPAPRQLFNCYTETNISDYEPEKKNNNIRFNTPVNGYIYSTRVEFNFTETTDGITQNKQISYDIRTNHLQAPTTELSGEISFLLEDLLFYNNALNLIDTSHDNATTTRKAGTINTIVTAGSESMATYYQVNNAFSVFTQTRPEFTNVSNGTGLVASRSQKVATANLTLAAFAKLRDGYPSLKFK